MKEKNNKERKNNMNYLNEIKNVIEKDIINQKKIQYL